MKEAFLIQTLTLLGITFESFLQWNRGNTVSILQGDNYYPNEDIKDFLATRVTVKPEPKPITAAFLKSVGFLIDSSDIFYINVWPIERHPSQRFVIEWTEKTGILCHSRYQERSVDYCLAHIKTEDDLANLFFFLSGRKLTDEKGWENQPREFCENDKHKWEKHYYGDKCAICGHFYPDGTAPWDDHSTYP